MMNVVLAQIPLEAQWWNPFSWDNAPLLAVVAGLWVIVMARANGTYWLGRAIANGTARTRARRMLESKHYRTAQRWLNRWGAPAVTVSFLTIGVQTMVNLGAGIMRMSLKRYLPAVAIGCVMWAFMYGTIGFIGWIAVVRLWEFSPLLTVLVGIALVAAVVLYVWAGRRDGEAAAEDAETESTFSSTVDAVAPGPN